MEKTITIPAELLARVREIPEAVERLDKWRHAVERNMGKEALA